MDIDELSDKLLDEEPDNWHKFFRLHKLVEGDVHPSIQNMSDEDIEKLVIKILSRLRPR